MQKTLMVLLVVMGMIVSAACSEKVLELQEKEKQQTTDPKQHTDEDASQSETVDMIGEVLIGYEKVYEETYDELVSNNGRSIGTEADLREVTVEGVSFMAGEGENPFMPFSKLLNEADGVNGNNQAFYIKFKPSSSNFGFMLQSDGSAGLTINEEGCPQLFVLNHEYAEDLDTDLRVEPNKWYHLLIAMGNDGLLQGAIWQHGNEDGAAYMNLHIGQSFGDGAYENQSWQVFVGFLGEATFTVESYAYYTFSDFVMGDRVLDMGDAAGNINKDDELYSMLINQKELWYEGSGGFAENNGGEFGGGVTKG